MILNLIVIALIGGIAFAWGSKGGGYGLFPAFLACLCTIAAGAIALSVWEPLTYGVLLANADPGSRLGSFLQDIAWGVGLLGPFIVSLLVLRLVVDSFVKRTLKFNEMANFVGGAAFGLVIGIVTTGMILISIGHMRLPAAILGYQGVQEKEGTGSPVYEAPLWVPADALTVMLYETLSQGAFRTETPLAVRHPDLHEQAGFIRMTYEDAGRITLRPEDVTVEGRYTVEGPIDELLADAVIERPQEVYYPNGEQPEQGDRIVGFVLRFTSGAKEKTGNVLITPSQLRLIGRVGDGEDAIGLHPIAVVAQGEAGSLGVHRFRFDVEDSVISSVGGGAEAVFAFEFVVPAEVTELTDLMIKGVRVNLLENPPRSLESTLTPDQRDNKIADSSIFQDFDVSVAGARPGDLDTSESVGVEPSASGSYPDLNTTTRIPAGIVLPKSAVNMELNQDNQIVSGEQKFRKEQTASLGLDPSLRVESFASTRDTGVVQVKLSEEGARSMYGRAIEQVSLVAPPLLYDTNGVAYEAIGYFYAEGDEFEIRYTPNKPIRGMTEVPRLSRTKPDQTLILLFRPSKGVRISKLTLGGKVVAEFEGPGAEVR